MNKHLGLELILIYIRSDWNLKALCNLNEDKLFENPNGIFRATPRPTSHSCARNTLHDSDRRSFFCILNPPSRLFRTVSFALLYYLVRRPHKFSKQEDYEKSFRQVSAKIINKPRKVAMNPRTTDDMTLKEEKERILECALRVEMDYASALHNVTRALHEHQKKNSKLKFLLESYMELQHSVLHIPQPTGSFPVGGLQTFSDSKLPAKKDDSESVKENSK